MLGESSPSGPRRALPWLVAGAVALTPASASALGRAGDLDPTFHGGTPVVSQLARTAPYSTYFSSILVDTSGRIVTSGATIDANGLNAATVARFDGDGNADGSFGEGGSFVRQLGAGANSFSTAGALFAVPGRYVGFGSYRIVNGRSQPSAFQQRQDGSADLDVGAGGLLTTDPVAPPATANTEGATAGPDGSVYVTGTVDGTPGSGRLLALTKFGPLGQVATGFGNRAGTWIGSFSESASDSGTYGSTLQMLPNDRLLVGGVGLLPSGRFGALLARFSTLTGQPDVAFGTRPGRTVIDASDPGAPSADSTIEELAVAPDGAIYGGGYGEDAQGRTAAMVARFTPLGRPDTSWGVNGVKRIQLATNADDRSGVQDLVLQGDGKVVVAAYISNGMGGSETRIVRLRDDATLDPEFGVAGVATPPLGREFNGSALTLSGGHLLIAGSLRVGTRFAGAITRMLLAPLPDPPPVTGGPGGPVGPGGPPPPGGPTGPGVARGRGTAGFSAKRLAVDRRGRVRVPLTCSSAGPCSGTVAIVGARGRVVVAAARRKRARRPRRASRSPLYARSSFSIRAGARATLMLRLSRAARSRAATRRGLSARLVLAAPGARLRTFKVTLVRR
jgi:uncharacterized delta-60 repeat protein